MGRIADLLLRIDDSLADEDRTRWPEARLLRLINEGQQKVARKSRCLRDNTPINIIGDQNVYELPDNALLLSRVTDSDGKELDMYSHDQMDKLDPTWETRTGSTIEAIVYDKDNPRFFKVYPIPLQSDGGETFMLDDFGVIATVEDDIVAPDFGVTVDITTTATKTATFSSVFGIVTGMSSIETTLKAYYNYSPGVIDAIDIAPSLLEVDARYDDAIKHYVVGAALRDDQDTQNRQVGNEELSLYSGELEEAKAESRKNYKSKQAHRTTYNGIG